MPSTRSLIAALTLALTAISCTDKGPTAPNDQPSALKAPVAAGPITQNVNGTLTDATGAAVATFVGTVSLTNISRDATGNLLGTVHVVGTATSGTTATAIDQVVTGVALAAPTSCPVLHLDLGPIHLNLLGLVVDLSRVVLDITAVPGPGNLLGNLLCAIVHLLDQSPINLTALDRLLALINAILAGL